MTEPREVEIRLWTPRKRTAGWRLSSFILTNEKGEPVKYYCAREKILISKVKSLPERRPSRSRDLHGARPRWVCEMRVNDTDMVKKPC